MTTSTRNLLKTRDCTTYQTMSYLSSLFTCYSEISSPPSPFSTFSCTFSGKVNQKYILQNHWHTFFYLLHISYPLISSQLGIGPSKKKTGASTNSPFLASYKEFLSLSAQHKAPTSFFSASKILLFGIRNNFTCSLNKSALFLLFHPSLSLSFTFSTFV